MVVKLGSVFIPNTVLSSRARFVKEIFLDFIPQTVRNILWCSYETGKVGPNNHAKFDEGMNYLPFKLLPPNQHDLERAKQGDKFPTEPKEVDVENELQLYVYPVD